MPKTLVANFLLATALFLAHFKAAYFNTRCLKWVWSSSNPSGVLLLARWSLIVVVVVWILVGFGLPAIPGIALSLIAASVHMGAMI